MSLSILDATTRAACAAATSQQTQCEALIAAWDGGNVTARLFAADGATLLRTLTLGPFTINSNDPRGVVCAAHLADTHVATGTPGLWVFRSGSTDIFSIDAGTSGASVNHAGAVKALCTPTLAGVVVTAQPELPALPTPAWLIGVGLHEWVEISGTSGAGGAQVDPWGAFAVDPSTGRLFVAASGGHNDSADNRVVTINLMSDTPTWTVLETASASFQESVSHYSPDGHPTSRHNYQNVFYVPSLDRIFLVGAQAAYGGPAPAYDNVDAYHVSGLAWDAADTYAPVPEGDGTYKAGVVFDGTRVWSNTLRTYNPVTNTWTPPSTDLTDTPAAQYTNGGIIDSPWSYDSLREQIFGLSWGTGRVSETGLRCARVPVGGSSKIAVTINDSAAKTAWIAERGGGYAAMDYDPENDRHLYYSGIERAADGNVASYLSGKVYAVTRNSDNVYDMSIVSLTGGPPTDTVGAGINGRFKYVPLLKGFVLLPQRTSNLWFFRVG